MVTPEADSCRYERKFYIDTLSAAQVRSLVRTHPAMFRVTYPARYVNNIYLDTPGMRGYSDNVDGHPDRLKVRIRWYGRLFGEVERPVLELKVKRGLVGYKRQFPLGPFTLQQGFSGSSLDPALATASLPDAVTDLLAVHRPVLVNRYRREYFATPDGLFRLTVDTELVFYGVDRLRSRFRRKSIDPRAVVVELKYGTGREPLAERISSLLPVRVTRSSKYVLGIESVGRF